MRKYKILFLCDFYNYGTGASSVVDRFFQYMPLVSDDSILLVKTIYKANPNGEISKRIRISNGADAISQFKEGGFDIIQWIKSASSMMFTELSIEIKQKKLNLPIISYVIQNPAYKNNPLNKDEIKLSKKIIFIDKAAYNNRLFNFIPAERKVVIYCNFSTEETIRQFDDIYKNELKKTGSTIVYGRGSTLNKCPKDMFERVFDKIDNPKKFIIIGGGERKWIEEKINERNNNYEVVLYDNLPYEEWVKQIVQFDVFLYYLPKDAYSSLDATLGHAMLQGKPVVYYGPDAPKERFKHGENGFVAETVDEIVSYCNLLAKDLDLRKRIGKKARETTINDFNLNKTIEGFRVVYSEVVKNKTVNNIKIPLYYDWYFRYLPKIINLKKYVIALLKGDISLIITRIKKI